MSSQGKDSRMSSVDFSRYPISVSPLSSQEFKISNSQELQRMNELFQNGGNGLSDHLFSDNMGIKLSLSSNATPFHSQELNSNQKAFGSIVSFILEWMCI